ncbi:MAG: SDR family NAD(P)-dependent oxidoreductase [Bdellovibrionaceae bacterium]|nr:SDR family NAD(P)-dependent oxidoreductase [Pseudobdellovibrionaceae bacterium]
MTKNTREEKDTRPLAVITGASSGIGYELANVFAENGFDLIVNAEDRGIVDAAHAFRRHGGLVEAVQADLATFEGVEKLYTHIVSLGRPLDSLVLNAGVGVGGEFAETELQDELRLIRLNIVSLVHLTKRILPDFIARESGRILFTSSIAAEMPGPYYAVYAASKAFVQSFSEALREEVKDKGIVVTALQPGATDTNFFARANMLDTKAGQGKKDEPAQVAKDGFDALMAGKDHVVAGSMMNKVQAGMAKIISEKRGAKISAKQTKPASVRNRN